MARDVIIGPVHAGIVSNAKRVMASVGRSSVWFDCRGAELDASPEAIAGTVLLAATEHGRRLRINDPVSAQWRSNLTQMMAIWQRWWGFPVLPPAAPELPAPRPARDGAILCFTGGLDSFYSLLHADAKPDALAFVHGYDITLDDTPRMVAWESAFREIAGAVGARALVLRSNLRSHPLVARSAWRRVHGGALAAIGHLLAPAAGTLLIASSFPAHYGYHWGSHVELDPLWSSDRLRVVHHGATHSRVGKMRAIVDHELPQRHLRVCWENRAPTGNCSRCDKCLCTMATILACGGQNRFRTFDWSTSVTDQVNQLPATQFIRTYGELLDAGLSASLAEAVRALLKRSAVKRARPLSFWQRWYRRRQLKEDNGVKH